jgi:hypothetical protein
MSESGSSHLFVLSQDSGSRQSFMRLMSIDAGFLKLPCKADAGDGRVRWFCDLVRLKMGGRQLR